MNMISYRLLFTLIMLLSFSAVVLGQEVKHERFIKVESDQFAEICTLFPTEINAHYKFAPDNRRMKSRPGISNSEINITYQSDCNGEDWPDEARTAFEFAADIWESHLDSDIPIRIEANWIDLGSNTLGSAGPAGFFTLSGEGVFPNTIYTVAQASALTGDDLVSLTENIDYDITVNMNCEFPNWYMETDANPPSGTLDAVTVLLHEIGHGIGFTGSMEGDPNGQVGDWGFGQELPFVFDLFAVEGEFNQLIDEDLFSRPSVDLYDALTGQEGGVFFSGFGAEFAINDTRVPLYSPDPYVPGSSYSHLDQSFFSNSENALMRPQLDQALAVHSPGPVFCGILEDMGWPIGPACEDLMPGEGFLARPVLLSPENSSGSQPVEPNLSWQAVAGATEYRVQLAEDFAFEDLIADQTVTGTSLTLDETLEFNTLYFWRVQAVSAGGNSKFSGKHRFKTTTDPPDAITLFFPEDGGTQLRPGFEMNWQRADRADEYQIQISQNTDFSQPVIDRFVSTTRFGATQDFDFSTTYYWRVRGVNTAGSGEWSMVRNFTTIIEKPDPVSLNTPSENENQVSVSATFSWTESSRASEYVLQISPDENFPSGTVIEAIPSGAMFTITEPLEYAMIYHWRVKAANVGGESDWSEVKQFTTVVQETAVMPNYPNPFNSSTTVRFQLSDTRNVTLDIFDPVGRRISVLVDEELAAGVYFENLQAAGFASGTYFIRFVAGDFMEVQKMAIIK